MKGIEVNCRTGEIREVDDGLPPPVPEARYRYRVFSQEVSHAKLAGPVYLDYQVLEFGQQLTAQEIADLETQLGKTIRRLEE